MASTRVSLSMDDSVLSRARHHSEVRKVSISKLFVSMVCMLDEAESRERELPLVTRQLQSAIKAGCTHLFTRNPTHFRSQALAVVPPASFIVHTP